MSFGGNLAEQRYIYDRFDYRFMRDWLLVETKV